MKTNAIFFAIIAVFGALMSVEAHAQTDTTVANAELGAELIEMGRTDQQIREDIMVRQREGLEITLADIARLDSVDGANRERLKAVIEEHGWPTPAMVGAEAANAAFLIAQHADRDLEFQRRSLEHLQEAFENGEASGQQLALLTDRVRVHEGRMQLYGTQANLEDGAIVLHPIEDSLHVDERRADLDLPPLDTYLDMLRKVYLGGASDDSR